MNTRHHIPFHLIFALVTGLSLLSAARACEGTELYQGAHDQAQEAFVERQQESSGRDGVRFRAVEDGQIQSIQTAPVLDRAFNLELFDLSEVRTFPVRPVDVGTRQAD